MGAYWQKQVISEEGALPYVVLVIISQLSLFQVGHIRVPLRQIQVDYMQIIRFIKRHFLVHQYVIRMLAIGFCPVVQSTATPNWRVETTVYLISAYIS